MLYFTGGMSLEIWNDVGILDRELAIYKSLEPHLRGITLATYGSTLEKSFGPRLGGMKIICNRWRLPQRVYAGTLSHIYPAAWRNKTIIKCNQLDGSLVALRAARQYRKKFVARCGYLFSENVGRQYGVDSREAKGARALEAKVFPSANRVVVTTQRMRRFVLDRYPVADQRITVIPNYVDTDLFAPDAGRKRAARKIAYVGRLEDAKNPLALLQAINGLDVQLVVAGDGSLGDEMRRVAAKERLNVEFLGTVPHRELPRILQDATMFVIPSCYEGHPKALLEAMATGTPVIGTDVPGIQDVISHRETGLLCDASPKGIRLAISEFLADADMGAEMGRRARDHVLNNFSLQRVTRMELDMLEEVVSA